MIRVVLPPHLRTLAQVKGEVTLDVPGRVTRDAVLDALEARYPMLRGTIRDHVTERRRPFLRFFACERDLTHDPPALMRYMLLIYLDEKALSEAERQSCYRESTQLAHDLAVGGQYVAASPLEPTARATSVRVRQGKRIVTDGPFAETKEQLGGYFLIDANDLDEAIAVAERIPMARRGTIEVRPVVELADLPED